MNALDFEKLGLFYLGAEYDLDAGARGPTPLLYDARDLVTHAVCVGMTGSGKTGLCLALVEEAAIDGIPAIIIDPKGDLANLLLTFPDLRPQDFAPWVNPEDALRSGLDVPGYAAQQAEAWRAGLASWHQDGTRIARLRDAAEFAVYTPGSSAGRPISLLRSFQAPPPGVISDPELLAERISTTVASLLSLVGVAGGGGGVGSGSDASGGREHTLLSSILEHAWSQGRSIDLPSLVRLVQSPHTARLGVMELESFYPAAERFDLAMRLNALIASPGFSRWTDGEPLDVATLLRTPAGKPRVSVFSIAHLGDAERMFLVSLLLGHVVGWMRGQSGTTSLRALLYMDEIAGYFPPVANPPSKGPLLTLMKQGRAFGLGVVLASQNPVDIDYKGLSNAGTWFIGRLQTQQDKNRVLDGLEGASASASSAFDRARADATISRLRSRIFLMNNVHDAHPTVFESRWCLSYLRGPLTRDQLAALKPAHAPDAPPNEAAANGAGAPAGAVALSGPVHAERPVLPPDVPQFFVPARVETEVVYQPMVLGSARVLYADARAGVNEERSVAMLAPLLDGPVVVDWDHAVDLPFADAELDREPIGGARFGPLPAAAARARSYVDWRRTFATAVGRRQHLPLWRFRALKVLSTPGESEADFRARLAQRAREERDRVAEQLRAKYAPRLATLQEKVRVARQRVETQRDQASAAQWSSAASFGSALLGAFLGRKLVSSASVGRAASAARSASRAAREAGDVPRAREDVDALRRRLEELEARFQSELAEDVARFDPALAPLERIAIKPRPSGINVRALVLAWAPFVAGRPAW
ncbi:MAG: ATP-binding protein [Phycisphaerales bacterium]